MGSSQLYSLTWGEFGTSLVSAVQLLRCHGDLVDVTLAAGGRSFPAHKIVLCAASPFLLNLLKSTPCQHPVVMLAGVTAPDLEALLEFVYRGEVSVDSSQLPSLLQAAHCLNIQGLAPGTISAEKPEEITTASSAHEALTRDVINSFLPIRRRKRTKRRNSSGPQSKWARQDGMSGDSENRPLDLQESGNISLSSEQDVLNIPDVPRKSEDLENNTQPEDSGAEGTSEDADCSNGGHTVLSCGPKKSHVPSGGMSSGVGGGGNSVSDQPATCPLCNATLRQARNLRRHLELLHFGVGRSTVRVRSRRASSPGAATVSGQPHQATTLSSSPASGGSGNAAAAAAVHALVGATVDAVVAAAAQRGANSTHSQSVAVPTVLAPAQHGSQLRTPPPLHPVTQPHPQSQMLQLAPLAPALLDAAQSHLLVPPLPPHCQAQGLTPPMRRLDESGVPPPSTLQSPPLLAATSSHEAFFRQHHSDLLRGVGLYADPRTLPPTSTPTQLPPPPAHTHPHGHQPPNQQSSVIRQEVV